MRPLSVAWSWWNFKLFSSTEVRRTGILISPKVMAPFHIDALEGPPAFREHRSYSRADDAPRGAGANMSHFAAGGGRGRRAQDAKRLARRAKEAEDDVERPTEGCGGSRMSRGGRAGRTHHRTLDVPRAEDTMKPALRRRGLRLEYLTIGWNAIEAIVCGGRRHRRELDRPGWFRPRLGDRGHRCFRGHLGAARLQSGARATGVAADRLSFFALAAYVVVQAVRDLLGGAHARQSEVGIVLAAVSLVAMVALAAAKRRTGRRLGSPTLVADSAETLLCAYLSVILLVGLVLNSTLGWWWADPLAAIGIAFLALREGRMAWEESTKDEAEQG